VPITAELEALGAQYQKITGGMTAEWDGERKALPQLAPYLESSNREIRERAFRLSVEPYVSVRPELAALFDELFVRRQRMVRAIRGPRLSSRQASLRHSAEDCATFHDAVLTTVVPAVNAPWCCRENLGLPRSARGTRRWSPRPDMPRPFGNGSDTRLRILISCCRSPSSASSPASPRGWTSTHGQGGPPLPRHPARRTAFHFVNASEAAGCDHAAAWRGAPFHACSHGVPSSGSGIRAPKRGVGVDVDGVSPGAGWHSRSDTLRGRQKCADPGRGRAGSLAHIACVDAFQHWIHTTHDGADAAKRDEEAADSPRFEPGVDWSGVEAGGSRWYRQPHIFLSSVSAHRVRHRPAGRAQVWRKQFLRPAGGGCGVSPLPGEGATRHCGRWLRARAGVR
jgi:oligoendopeptidase F